MATIPRAALDYVNRQLAALSADAQSRVLSVLEAVDWGSVGVAEARELIVEALRMVLPTYTDAAAQLGAALYDAVRTLAVGEAYGATAVSGYDAAATEGAVRALARYLVKGSAESFRSGVLDRVDYEIRRAENVSVASNAASEGVRYARVPTGLETCGFCIMLASRGFVYTSAEAASHSHSSCDCRVIPGFPGAEVEGYDPSEYLGLYSEARSRLGGGASDGQIASEIERILAEPGKATPTIWRQA